MKRICPILILLAVTFSCDDPERTFCITGEVVAFEGCANYSIIEVDEEYAIGNKLETANGTLENAIQVPGELSLGRGFFKL